MNSSNNSTFRDLTLAWGLSEANIGGILHAFKVPFSGLVISNLAVQFIVLLAYTSQSRFRLLSSLKTVLVLKAAGSPHSPITAYFAVTLQGLLGTVLFFTKKFFRLSAFLLGLLASLFSGTQKLFVLWVVFGSSFYVSLNEFLVYTVTQIIGKPTANEALLIIPITIYLSLYSVAGMLGGYFAGKLPQYIEIERASEHYKAVANDTWKVADMPRRKKRRSRLIMVLMLPAFVLVLASYLIPGFFSGGKDTLWVTLTRPFVVIVIWYKFLSPYATKLLHKYLLKQTTEIGDTAGVQKLLSVAYLSIKRDFPNQSPLVLLRRFMVRFFTLVTDSNG